MNRRISVAAGLLLAGLLAAITVESRAEEGLLKVGDAAPALKAVDLEGKDVGLGDLKGQVIFMNFFALG